MGLEQEYGITVAGVDPARAPHPSRSSNAVVRAYRDATEVASVGFDLESEAPLADMWGFRLPREQAHPDQLTDESPLASRMLSNGARCYVDHAHPEFSGPEVASAYDAVRYDRAGDLIMAAAARAAAQRDGVEYRLFKNNTDGKGQSYGSHENYLIARSLPFDDVVAHLTAHLVTRSVLTGAGRVGIGPSSQEAGFQLTQRADFFECPVSLTTTMHRGLINTRDEPHANPRLSRRLHVITGDANQSQVAVLLKAGGTALVLGALAAGLRPNIELTDPVAAFRAVSRDLDLSLLLECRDGRRLSALDIQEAWLEQVRIFAEREPDVLPDAHAVIDEWGETLDLLRDGGAAAAADRVEWAAKLGLLQRYRERDGLAWDAPRLAAVDLQWADIDPARSLACALERAGRLRTLLAPGDAEAAMTQPPADTRAWLRGTALRQIGRAVARVGWDSMTLRLDDGAERTVRMSDPTAWTRDAWAEALRGRDDVQAWWEVLRATGK